MKHTVTTGIAALVLGASATGLALSQAAPAPGTAGAMPGAPMNDAAFAAAARRSNDAEIADARYILRVAKDATVRDYATQMIADHSTGNVSLEAAARKDGVRVVVPRRPPAAAAAIQGVAEPQLDAAYMRDEVADQTATLALMNGEAAGGAGAELKAFAQAQVPVVQGHLNRAQAYVAAAPRPGISPIPVGGGIAGEGNNAGNFQPTSQPAAPAATPNAPSSHAP